MQYRTSSLSAALTLFLTIPPATAQDSRPVAVPGAAAAACSPEAIGWAGKDVTIRSVRWLAKPTPYCRVDGIVRTDNPGPNTVGFMIALPQSWNGRYLMVIPGGSAGYIVNPSREHITAGYAVATTDKGSHSGGALDMSFRADPGKSEDYAHRGTHVAAIATQAIARGYYARERMPRYIMGCSGGGVSTLMEAEKYPGDADGFIAAGAPTNAYVQTFWAFAAQHVARDPARWISPAEMSRVGQAIMARYDESDGARDGLIWDPTQIALTQSLFPFLTDAQYSTLEVLAGGLPEVAGSEVTAPGFWMANPSLLGPIGLGTAAPPWNEATRPPLFGSTVLSMKALRGEGYDALTQMDFTDARQLAEEKLLWDRVGGYGYAPSNLRGLSRSDSKLILWTGASDEAIPPAYTANYSKGVRAIFGADSADFFQSFFVPGMFHCRGGEGSPTDSTRTMLEAMQRWVEAGERPSELVMSNTPREIEVNSTSNTSLYVSGMSTEKPAGGPAPAPPRTFRICAFPTVAQFSGNPGSDINDARNWRCTGTMKR
ncbi:tannase/feruloyl esterase family alpha/beta hydrolase [Sphingopyxis sp.]|uniref:tannase/feruloyl esterase family alpha/beta hydrolase n=1 Tax=Sphingopyxis sp. TaxID=1908224 RepID=UPI002D77D082|nr:tannase/feruloyl esterase family alpha/beta hydrolase [Sphingopyxis sp.]HET6524443.1 tannase/feruloyl esterase family alpha/beta hydrolase [Sphingopyxis sp.]